MALQPGDRVLEVGVGTGISAALYPSHARVIGIDRPSGMVGVQMRLDHTSRRRTILVNLGLVSLLLTGLGLRAPRVTG